MGAFDNPLWVIGALLFWRVSQSFWNAYEAKGRYIALVRRLDELTAALKEMRR